jgi:hypothetical protein
MELELPGIRALGVFWDLEVGSALGFGAWTLGFDYLPLAIATPGLARVCSPFFTTTTPFTST